MPIAQFEKQSRCLFPGCTDFIAGDEQTVHDWEIAHAVKHGIEESKKPVEPWTYPTKVV
jgi:hypothetical protein